MSRVVVIGAGVGGLSAAVRLAEAGHRVEVHERAPVVGGKLGVYERDGFRFDTGPSLLTLPRVFDGLGLTPQPLDPVVRHVFADGAVLDSSSDHEVFLSRIAAALGDPAAAADWDRFWARARRIWDASWTSVLQRPVTAATVARMSWRVRDLAAIAPWRSLRALGRHYLRDPRLRTMLERYATYTGADPRRAPAALAAVPYAELAFGGWYLPGGLGTIATALLARCRALGVQVHTGSPVTRIVADRAVRGVRLAGGAVRPADVVVSNVDALTTYRELWPAPDRLARLADRSLAGFVLLLGVRGATPSLAHHTAFFPRDYDAEFDAVFGGPGRRARPAPDPTVFVTRALDPVVHPPGHEAWFVLVNAPPQGNGPHAVDWRRPGLADAYARHLLGVLARRGLDVRDRLLFAETRTPADLADATGAPGGTIYGTAGGLLRPPNRGPVGGLWLVGGSTHPGGGLPMVTLSARIVADQVGPARPGD
ncbi:phytoene desaturase family protein [Mangrovihabitans endophyticus]|uniref:4,4'-diaponeurosporene oxygenase n=1 Tax=Mangrovihabitans endophyticus TaxID=1751298 RepID=A0A8J3FKY6_9ACTN|nr:phytoene desaturase family protein [Mangrovihabitans endophyticus]GGK70308.1 phytoene desaturase [Mangrovihabitans endophyticus]